jgi:dolichol-phosphate mannosyltransferase
MYYDNNWAIIIPMANEEPDFVPFVKELTTVLDRLKSGHVYFVVDNASKDRTLELCNSLSASDKRYTTVFAPDNRNVVDAYLRGYKEAYKNGHDIIIEMDAGLSHDPAALPMFLRVLNEGNECAFGSRFMNGGSMVDSPFKRRMLSKTGTILSNLLLGTGLYDMTSGYQGFHSHIVKQIIEYPLQSRAHFYQTELRYLLRKKKFAEVPIHYKAPSPRVSQKAITNSIEVLLDLFIKRLTFRSPFL